MPYLIVMQEGLANVCLVTSAMTITRAKIERKIPKKDMVSFSNFKYGFVFTDFHIPPDFSVREVIPNLNQFSQF